MIRVGPEAHPPTLTLGLMAATVVLSAGLSEFNAAQLKDLQAAR
jgi:hypothetical protein